VLTAARLSQLFLGRCRLRMALLHQGVGQLHPEDPGATTLGSKTLIQCDAQNENDN
jgi:hypothetical protein